MKKLKNVKILNKTLSLFEFGKRRKRNYQENMTIISSFNSSRQLALKRLKQLFPDTNLRLSANGEIVYESMKEKFKIYISK